MQENNNIRNKIITISGQPVTGKSTNIKAIIEKLKLMGYKEENIHLESTGKDFRNFFNIIVDFIKNIENDEIIKRLSETPELKQIFENEEYRQVFSQVMARLKKANINFSEFTIEQANNMKELKEIRHIVDTIIDKGMEERGKIINQEERPDEIWIIDSRLAFSNIPNSFSVRLTATPEVAAQRLFNDKSRGNEDSKYHSIEEAKEAREKRRLGEVSRYKERYGVDLEDPENYDLIIDTSYSTIDDISDTILTCLECYHDRKPYAKNWTSPKTLLPLQSEMDTLSTAQFNLEEMVESIQKYGYFPENEIETVEVDNRKYIIEGHHRNFASAYIGKTLVPYKILAKDDEVIPRYGNTARQRANSITKSMLYGHEGLIEKPDSKFSYENIYPGIYAKISELEEQDR